MTNKPATITESQWDEALRDAHQYLHGRDTSPLALLHYHGSTVWNAAKKTITEENDALFTPPDNIQQQAIDKAREYLAVAPENRSPAYFDWQQKEFGVIGWHKAIEQAKQEQERAEKPNVSHPTARHTVERAEKIAGNLQKLAALIEQHPDNYLQVIQARVAGTNDDWEYAKDPFELAQFAADYDMEFRIKTEPTPFDKSREQFEYLYTFPPDIRWNSTLGEYTPDKHTAKTRDEARQFTTMLYCFHAGRQSKEDT